MARQADGMRLHMNVVQIMQWNEQVSDASGSSYWRNRLTQIRLDAVVLVEDLDIRPAGHDVVNVVLDTVPAREIVVDGRLDNWWYTNDPLKKGADGDG